jgi:hypothetical protein
MAARDQKIQSIYVVTVSILCAMFLIGWLYTAFTASTTSKQLVDAEDKANKARTEITNLKNHQQAVGKMLGAQAFSEAEYKQLVEQLVADEEIQKLINQFNKDMALFGPSTPPEQRNYAGLVSYLMQELRARNQQVENTNRELIQAKDENLAVVKREREASANEKKRADGLESQLTAERADFAAKLSESEKSLEEVSKTLTISDQNHKKEKNKYIADANAKDAEMNKMRQNMAQLREELDQFRGDDFQSAQGQVTSSNNNAVWINLGKQDGLQKGTRFSVIDPDQSRITDDVKPKAHIEVVQVEGKLARARILESSNGNPIVKGDLVYSVAWQPGSKVEFALVGKMDTNGDGVDDRSVLKQLIQESGGEVVEELLPDGKQVGKMSHNTRWLVIGEAYDPANKTGLTNTNDYGTKYVDVVRRAKDLSVTTINLDKLMSYLRANTDDASIPMGNAMRPGDLRTPETYRPNSGASVSDVYKNVRPTGPLSGN